MTMFKKQIDKREEYIYPYVKDKEVLDLGPGDISYRYLHKFIENSAENVIGLEIDEERKEKLRAHGHNIKLGNAQNFNFNKRFDVVVAGDLIEHLTNFEGFFNSIKSHLKKNGRVLINTPNVFGLFVLIGLQRKPFHEHTCWFCENTFKQLVEMFGLEVEKTIYYSNDYGTLKGKIFDLLTKVNPKWNTNMLFIVKKK